MDGDSFLGTEMDNKSAGNASLGGSILVIGWNDDISLSIIALVTNTGTTALKESADIDTVLGVEPETDKVSVKGWNGGSLISIGALVTTKGTEEPGNSLSI